MIDSYVAQIAAAQEAADSLAEHQRLERLASSLEGLKAAQEKQRELDRLYNELCETQADLRAHVAAALIAVPAWRAKFAETHQALVNVVAEVDQAQAPIVRAGDALKRAHKIERTIQGLEGRGETGSTVQKMWDSAGGNNPDLDPLRGLETLDPGLKGWFTAQGVRFLFSQKIGLRHFFRG